MDRILKARHPEISNEWKAPRITLFYICKNQEEASFDDDILAQVASSPFGNLKNAREAGYEYVLHDQTMGRFTVANIKNALGEQFIERLFFLCGPTPMLDALSIQLIQEGVSPMDIIIEDFNLV